MKEQLKELGYWFEGKIKDLCGELTSGKRVTAILVMLLILVTGNLYFTISTIYNWGKENEKKHPDIEHVKGPDLERNKHKDYDFMNSPLDRKLFDLEKEQMKWDSIDSINSNKQRFKEYERTIKNKYPAKAKA